MAAYQPERGDFIDLDFSPQAGSEQAGRRPALVLSPLAYNVATGLVFVCPVTNQIKGGAFEVPVPTGAKVTGAVLSDHLRSVDWIARNADFHSAAPKDLVFEVLARIEAILTIES
ncbi:MAG: type II toxin-antitoxin system PemK/MazF family toxin [Kiloniellales bacterium]